jgi:mannitol/fructose-specific phosphotransferase system IIA component (Ntr-type)
MRGHESAEKRDRPLTLCEHLAKTCIQIGIEATEREEVLAQLAIEAEASGLVNDHRRFLENLQAREAEMSTGVGRGLAVPHAEVVGASHTFVIGATLNRPVPYHSIDGAPVDVIFLIGGKPGEVGLHLQILARIARLARQPEFLARLRIQKTAEDFLAVIQEAEKALYDY